MCPDYTTEMFSRFWSKVDKSSDPDGCWLWTAAQAGKGYGVIRWHDKMNYAHRISYEIAYGAPPNGQYVCHACDNPLCVNPNHLFLGTSHDNHVDMMKKGRGDYQTHKGENNGNHRLTTIDVIQIRQKFSGGQYSKGMLAREYNVTRRTIRLILEREIWNHIES